MTTDSKSTSEVKDWWDKSAIIISALGTILTPVIIGLSVWWWNSDRTQRETASQMISIAVSILTLPPTELDTKMSPLRSWAIDVLQNPSDPPVLSDEAAVALEVEAIPMWGNPFPSGKSLLGLDASPTQN